MHRTALALLAMLAVFAAACGDDATSDPAPSETPADAAPTDDDLAEPPEPTEPAEPADGGIFPVTITADNGEVTVESRPTAIVSFCAASTESLFAIGAGEQVLAVDSQSNFPPEAPITDLSSFEPNIEAVAALEPDLVIAAFAPGDFEAGLAALGIPVVIHDAPVDLDGAYAQIEQLGIITGNVGGAAEVVGAMQTEIDALVAQVPDYDVAPTYYHELDAGIFTLTSGTFAGSLYRLAGLANIADAADGAEGGYPQLSVEYLLDTDPDYVFLADTKCCGESAETFAARPGFDELSATASGRIIELDDDIASRWGPRVVDFFEVIVRSTSPVEVAN